VMIYEKISHLAGIEEDFKLHVNPVGTPEEQKKAAADQLKKLLDVVMKAVDQKLQQDLTPLLKEVKTLQTDVGVVMRVANIAPPPQTPPPNAPQPATAAPAIQS
jgi:hypothetical protein